MFNTILGSFYHISMVRRHPQRVSVLMIPDKGPFQKLDVIKIRLLRNHRLLAKMRYRKPAMPRGY